MCIATDAEDKGTSQQDVERLSRRRLVERLGSRETAKARVKARERKCGLERDLQLLRQEEPWPKGL